jgi:hypothetical protein
LESSSIASASPRPMAWIAIPSARGVKDANRPHRERENGLRVKVVAKDAGHEADTILRPRGTA